MIGMRMPDIHHDELVVFLVKRRAVQPFSRNEAGGDRPRKPPSPILDRFRTGAACMASISREGEIARAS
jgi:hypothetical protein